ncbi:MAG: hypothetical protein KAW09_03080 [Thermoplasmata archaeon]|nr:hypothetical protein [Thermoplasmata archaeon]
MTSEKRKPRKKGEGHEEPCLVCGETRFTEESHFPRPKEDGGDETIPLCPAHHRMLDKGRLRGLEYEAIWKSTRPEEFKTVIEFVEWADQNGYPYHVSDLERKFWFDESHSITTRLVVEEAILGSSASILLAVEFGEAPFIVGAPHHAPGGVDRLPCDRVSDENVGFLALDLAKLLGARCIVAANYWLDANKGNGDYVDHIIAEKMDTFVEIHGHNGIKTEHEIEISCGTPELTERSDQLAATIRDIIKDRSLEGVHEEIWDSIGIPKMSGDFSDVRFKAKGTCSICHVRRLGGIPYHIEISPRFRKDKDNDNRVPREGKVLMGIIAEALRQLHPSPE